MATLKNVYLGLQYLKPDAELWLEASAKLVYQWFFVPMPEGDWWYYYGLFEAWQGVVNPSWYNLDVEEKADLFSKFWFHKIDSIINWFRCH